jgi:hypothetical protein
MGCQGLASLWLLYYLRLYLSPCSVDPGIKTSSLPAQ